MTPVASPLLASTTTDVASAASSARDKLAGVAKQFEAIFLRQMLAAARKTNFEGEDGLDSGQGMDTFTQMQDERFADIAADTGAFGLGKMIETHLARFLPVTAADAAKQQEGTGHGV
jgi:flagellar protein FlgJ